MSGLDLLVLSRVRLTFEYLCFNNVIFVYEEPQMPSAKDCP
jgi:hypothetical protein